MTQGVVMIPTMDVTIKNIKLLSPSSYEKASEYIESLLRADKSKSENKHVSNEIFMAQAETLFDEYDEAFSVLAK